MMEDPMDKIKMKPETPLDEQFEKELERLFLKMEMEQRKAELLAALKKKANN